MMLRAKLLNLRITVSIKKMYESELMSEFLKLSLQLQKGSSSKTRMITMAGKQEFSKYLLTEFNIPLSNHK
jgi:hypothetical protein